MTFVLAECYEADPRSTTPTLRRREGADLDAVTERPLHLLDPHYAPGTTCSRPSIEALIEEARPGGRRRPRREHWSDYNVTAYRHPLSAACRSSAGWLDMPQRACPATCSPRACTGAHRAPRSAWSSRRAAKQNGIMHMPTGQSGHPLSPFYANSHAAWARGEATPLLPGATEHVLTLVP